MSETRVIERVEETVTVLPVGAVVPSCLPDMLLIVTPEQPGFQIVSFGGLKQTILEVTTRTRVTEYFAHLVSTTYRFWAVRE